MWLIRTLSATAQLLHWLQEVLQELAVLACTNVCYSRSRTCAPHSTGQGCVCAHSLPAPRRSRRSRWSSASAGWAPSAATSTSKAEALPGRSAAMCLCPHASYQAPGPQVCRAVGAARARHAGAAPAHELGGHPAARGPPSRGRALRCRGRTGRSARPPHCYHVFRCSKCLGMSRGPACFCTGSAPRHVPLCRG